jgi:hypothetical protein
MAAKKNFYYVLVFGEGGPKYVTKVNHSNKTAHWNESEKPLELGKYNAEDLALGLNCNFFNAVVVSSRFEIETQPYNYSMFEIDWKRKEA